MSLELAQKYVHRLLEDRSRGTYKIYPRGVERIEVIPGLLYRFSLYGRPVQELSLSLFLKVGDLGAALWEQEMRTMQRLAGFDHPALPTLFDGGHLPGLDGDNGAAYVRAVRLGEPADTATFASLVEQSRADLLRHLWLLADALGILHGASISHRALWPGALQATAVRMPGESGDESRFRIDSLQLARFEMSALLANLFNTGGGASYQQLRDTYLADGPRSLVYAPPERLDFIFGRPDGQLGGPLGDVFSLGMMAAQWLVPGDPPPPQVVDHDAVKAHQAEVRRRVGVEARDLPGQLIEVIQSMLDPRPTGRPTAFQVSQTFAASYADAQQLLRGELPDEPYLMAYMPEQSDRYLLHSWNLIQDSATTPQGADQMVELIEGDMRGAEVLHSPSGAQTFASDEDHKLRRATTVVVGIRVTWFCEQFWVPVPGGSPRRFDEIMMIKYLRRTEDILTGLQALRVTGLAQRLPMVEAVVAPMHNLDLAEFLKEGRPRWSEFVDRSVSGRANTPAERQYLESLDWYIQYQRAMLDARTYAYEVDPGGGGGDRVQLRWNADADRTRALGQSKVLSQNAILDTQRQDMAVFVGNADDGVDRGQVHLARWESPEWDSATSYEILEVIEPDIVVVSTRGKHAPPNPGWLRLSHDAGTSPQIFRQAEALVELGANRVLLQQLINPKTDERPADRWGDAGGDLLGDGRAAVLDILRHEGMFAVQGPPGTGKTEVTSQAVVEYLTQEPSARVLVSAQSHDALENLALRITRKLGITVPPGSDRARNLDRLALRVRSRSTSYESNKELAGLQPAQLAEAVTDCSMARSRQWLASRRAELPGMVPVVQRWIDRAPEAQLELTRRVRTAANLVFATTGTATKRNLFVEATSEPFDWVVIEEAGRAWPTELALPLVRGIRWTMVGDHAQIGAYQRDDVARFLEGLSGYEGLEIKAMYDARARHLENFGTFARFFSGGATSPSRVLSEQYRMDRAISDVVGSVFYSASGGLEAMRAPAEHPLEAPHDLVGARLVWIDTGLAERSVGYWANDYEAGICADLIRSMRPEPGLPGNPSLALITPYRDQEEVLQQRIPEHVGRISTVDRFQGREADIIVVSLVRDRVRPMAPPVKTVGFLADPARINVLLSRSRELLVVVGRYDVYAHSAGPKWGAVAKQFLQTGLVLRAGEGRG